MRLVYTYNIIQKPKVLMCLAFLFCLSVRLPHPLPLPHSFLIRHFKRAKVKGREGDSEREGWKRTDEWIMRWPMLHISELCSGFGLVFSDAVKTIFVSFFQAMLGDFPCLVILRRCDSSCGDAPNQLLS